MKTPVGMIVLAMVFGLVLNSCKQNEVDGIVIEQTLFVHQTLQQNQELRSLIHKTLDHDAEALAELVGFWCGGGAGCYDLGSVLTQIAFKMGQKDFTTMASKLDNSKLNALEGLMMAGLEYGDNDKDGTMDDQSMEAVFPKLQELFVSRLGK